MKHIIILLLLFSGLNVAGQVYVSLNSYIYVNDQVLFVKQDVNLQNNGNIYLRNESQLLQGTAGASSNTGLGKLSVFQEGTSDNYDYNYWCSPVGNALATPGNSSFGITMLNMPTGLTSSTPAVMLGTTVLDGIASPLSIAQRWVFKYINSNNYSQWVQVNSATNIAAGEGFTMKGTSGTDATTVNGLQNNSGASQRYDFRGKPNDGNIAVTVGAANMTLTGNPYPSALNVNKFLLDAGNTAMEATAYYWEQNKATNSHFLAQYQGGYGTYVPVSLASNGIYLAATFDTYDGSGNLNTTGSPSGLVIERKYAPIGQGFMVKGITNGSVTLNNSHREYYKEAGALSQFERLANVVSDQDDDIDNGEVSQIRINASFNNQFTKQLALAFVTQATDGIDRGIDGESPTDEELPNDVYFTIDGRKFVIEGIDFDISKRVPIGIKAANDTSFRFSIPGVFNFDENQDVYIYDGLDGSYHNIRTGNYDLTLDAGVYEDRFEITFAETSLGVPAIQIGSLEVVQNNDSQLLTLNNPDGRNLISCGVYDMTGKELFSMTDLGNEPAYSFSTSGFSDGIYIVKITDGEQRTFGQKISVFQKGN
jgi:hypothetical protein